MSSVYLILGVQFRNIWWRGVAKMSEKWRRTAVQEILCYEKEEIEVGLDQSEVTVRRRLVRCIMRLASFKTLAM